MNVDLFLALPYLSCCELLCFTFKFYHLEKLETRKKCWIPELCWEIPETFSLSSLHPLAPRGTYWPTDCLICWFSTTLNQKKTANKFANELRIVLKLEKFIATFLSPPNLPDTANTSNCLWREDWPFPYLTVIESVENSWETDWLTVLCYRDQQWLPPSADRLKSSLDSIVPSEEEDTDRRGSRGPRLQDLLQLQVISDSSIKHNLTEFDIIQEIVTLS